MYQNYNIIPSFKSLRLMLNNDLKNGHAKEITTYPISASSKQARQKDSNEKGSAFFL